MKSKLTNLLLVIMFLAGLSLLLYPTVSNYYNSIHQTRAIQEYSKNVDQMEEEVYKQLWSQAEAYNQILAEKRLFSIPKGYEEAYYSMLDASGKGIMAYVEIPSIEVTLPIMHGTSDAVLNKAVGHMEWSSLPVGGESTHSVLSGHRGLPSSELFTNLDLVEVGDTFYIHVLGQTLTYYVDQIVVVLPNEYKHLQIVDGQDYVTLMTCTPYGVNTHRLLVRGARMASDQHHALEGLTVKNEVENVDLMILLPAILVTVSVIVFLSMAFSRSRKGRKGDKHEKK